MKQVHQTTISHIRHLKEQDPIKYKSQITSLRVFYQRLFWRCHFVQKLESQPSIEYHNQNREFDQIRTAVRQDYIQAWYHGMTGIPLIDAGMRCLQATGWINFRMRATLVSFICNTCMQPRQEIHHMLARVFLDYEPGLHYSQLQMQSGTTGINTIRIYNPLKQLVDKDEDLTFIRRWLPELVSLTSDEIKALGTGIGNQLLHTK
jgi:deoxyribodipyrimidine photo-lyase